MTRWVRTVALSTLAMLGSIAVAEGVTSASASASAAISLSLPQSDAFAILGYWCGGIQEQSYATGFDAASGYPTGDVYLKTTCNGSGRGGNSTTYTAWAGVTWDFTGAVVADGTLTSPPTVDPSLTAYDGYGNEVYNASSSAFLVWAPGYVPAPRVTGLSETVGPASGGTSLTITGDGFTGATAVDFGDTPAASYSLNGDTSITAISPTASQGTVDVTVTTAGGPNLTGPSDQFTFVAEPSVSGLNPNRGPLSGGTLVTISGANFTDASSVSMGDTAVGFEVVDDSTITVVTPPGESLDSEQFTVTSVGGTSTTSSADQFTYGKSTIALSRSSGAPGSALTVSGHGYSRGETVDVTYKTGLRAPNPTSVEVCSAQASAKGAFSCQGTVPTTDAGSLGSHKVTAKGTASLLVASTSFKLT